MAADRDSGRGRPDGDQQPGQKPLQLQHFIKHINTIFGSGKIEPAPYFVGPYGPRRNSKYDVIQSRLREFYNVKLETKKMKYGAG